MNTSLQTLARTLSLSALALGLSSCSLFKNGKYASQWEIQSEVPSSLNSGQASAPAPSQVPQRTVKSNLSGADPLEATDQGTLDLPVAGGGPLIDIPKPEVNLHGTVYQSPPEFLGSPTGAGHDLPSSTAGGAETGLTSLLQSPPPPAVTEEELSMAPAALPPAMTVEPDPAANPAEPVGKAPVGPVLSSDSASPGIPLLYGKLDLSQFLTAAPPAPSPQQTASTP